MVSEEKPALISICTETDSKPRNPCALSSANPRDYVPRSENDNFPHEELLSESDIEQYVRSLLVEICETVAAKEHQVMTRDRRINVDERSLRKMHRRTSILDLMEQHKEMVDENENISELQREHRDIREERFVEAVNPVIANKDNKLKDKIKETKLKHSISFSVLPQAPSSSPISTATTKLRKKLSFSSFLQKKPKTKGKAVLDDSHPENYDDFDLEGDSIAPLANQLGRSKKSASALDLSHHHRSASFSSGLSKTLKKIVHLGGESKTFLKRSMSLRDVSKNRPKSLTEIKELEWKQSLQSLVETDVSVSYDDLSFVNYDELNRISYEEKNRAIFRDKSNNIARTQSMIEKRSPVFRRPLYGRHLSVACEDNLSAENASLAEQSGTLSLPSLHHLQENVGRTATAEPPGHAAHRYRRRQQSISSEEGRSRTDGSFRSAGSGCAKLKRQNACRQKNREGVPFCQENKHKSENTVRSRSLNHLDMLEMRQGVVPAADPALKDSRSEPDCTKSSLAPPPATPEPPTPTKEPVVNRRHMLSRSQKSSSECFSVNFEVGDEATWDNELFFIAQRGITLHDSLAKMCEFRNIDLCQCEARLQDKENNTETVLNFTQDTGSLVGRHIRITAKEKKIGPLTANHSRKPSSGGSRTRTSSFFSSSTEEATTVVANSTLSLYEVEQGKKPVKQRFTSFFGNSKDTKYEALIEQLDKYSKLGIPNNVSYPQGQCESVDALYRLEEDWRDIIDYSDLTEKQQQQQTVLWELITSEVSYIRTLKVVTDLFLACLKDLQSHNLLKEIDREKLFSNITEILDSNVIFWRNTLFPLIRDMRRRRQATCIENMLEGFSSIHEIFRSYYTYCAEQARCQHYCRENMERGEVFTAYLTWCESQKECNRLRLMDILVQPMQRLTKYGLLLKAILKNTDEDVERESLQSMIKMVDDFVVDVNASLKHRQDNERLKGIIARIESYDVVESKDDDLDKILKKEKQYTQLDLTKPMLNCPVERKRHLLLEGDLKLKDSSTSKMEVHCFLLTDMLLICKPSTKKGGSTMRVVRQPYLVDRMVVTELQRETPSLAVIYKNEFEMAVAAFILQNNDAKKLKGWKDGIAKAQVLYSQAKQMIMPDESLEVDYSCMEGNFESDYQSLQLAPRSPLASSSRASRVSSLAHSHSGSVEMNDQSSVGSAKDHSRGVSIENENRTGSISSDEGVQPLPPDKSPVSQKNSFKNRIFKSQNTLSVQPFGSLGQSLPNLALGSPSVGGLGLSLNLNQHTLSVPSKNNGGHLLSPTHRGISYPPPSPTRGNLRRGLAISQSKNPPLIKTRHVNSTAGGSQVPASLDFDVPVIAGVPHHSEEHCESFSRGHHRQAMKRTCRSDKRYHTAGVVDDLKKSDCRDSAIHKRLSWNCGSQESQRALPSSEDHT